MANTSRINGFRPVKMITGAPYNGQGTMCYVYSASGNLGVGDVVKLEDRSTNAVSIGVPTVDQAAAGDAAFGVIIGMINAKLDPVTGTLTTGSISLDTPQYLASGSSGYVIVETDPNVIYRVQANATVNAKVGATAVPTITADQTSTLSQSSPFSSTYVTADSSATAASMFQIIGLYQEPNNVPGAYNDILVKFNKHQYLQAFGA